MLKEVPTQLRLSGRFVTNLVISAVLFFLPLVVLIVTASLVEDEVHPAFAGLGAFVYASYYLFRIWATAAGQYVGQPTGRPDPLLLPAGAYFRGFVHCMADRFASDLRHLRLGKPQTNGA